MSTVQKVIFVKIEDEYKPLIPFLPRKLVGTFEGEVDWVKGEPKSNLQLLERYLLPTNFFRSYLWRPGLPSWDLPTTRRVYNYKTNQYEIEKAYPNELAMRLTDDTNVLLLKLWSWMDADLTGTKPQSRITIQRNEKAHLSIFKEKDFLSILAINDIIS